MLFSATMPASLLEFTKISLNHPIIIRLDTDMKLSPHLQISYVFVRSDYEKMSTLLYLLIHILKIHFSAKFKAKEFVHSISSRETIGIAFVLLLFAVEPFLPFREELR